MMPKSKKKTQLKKQVKWSKLFNYISEGKEKEKDAVGIIKYVKHDELLNKRGSEDEEKVTVLILAAQKGLLSVVQALIDRADNLNQQQELINALSSNGSNALHFAAQEGHIKVVTLLLNKFPNSANVRDNCGNTALHWAVYNKSEKICKLLIPKMSKKAFSAVDDDGKTALYWACQNQLNEICKLLIPKMEKEAFNLQDNHERNTALIYAAFHGLGKICELLIPEMSHNGLNSTDTDGDTALTYAIKTGLVSTCKLLIPKMTNANINARNLDGTNPLGMVFLNLTGHPQNIIKQIAKLFIKEKAFNVNAYLNNKVGMNYDADKNFLKIGGFNVLHYALKLGYVYLLDALVERQHKHLDVNFFYPAQNPKYHMCSPNKILAKLQGTKSATTLTKLLENAQKSQEDREQYTDGDSDTEGDNAFIWKKVLKDMVNSNAAQEQAGKYVMPLFHGVPFMTNLYTFEDRTMVAKKLLSLNPGLQNATKQKLGNGAPEESKAIYSRTSTASSGVANLAVVVEDAQALNELKNKNATLKQSLVKAYKNDLSNNKAVFQGIVLNFVNEYKDINGATQRKVWEGVKELNSELSNDIVKYRFPFISTTKAPDHAVSYGFGLRLEDARGEGRLNPKYDNNGKPQHRLAGLVYIIKEDAISIEEQISSGEIFDVCSLKGPSGKGPNGQFANQIEVAYLGGVSADKVLAIIPLVYPNFSKEFKVGYHDTVYGYSKTGYKKEANFVKTNKKITENDLKNIFIKYIDKIANKFSDGALVTLFPKETDGNFTFAKYITDSDYVIGSLFNPETGHRKTSLNHAMLTIKDKSSRAYKKPNIVEELTFEGQGILDYGESNYWYVYTKIAMNELLQLRSNSVGINEGIEIFIPNYVFDDSNASALRLTKDITMKTKDTLLVSLNLHGKHWVGIVIDKTSDEINIHYMDPEQQAIPALLKKMLAETLAMTNPEQRINITETELEPQKYNNCGPEVIENFMQYLTNHRLSQEDAVPVHALLYEDSIMLVGDC
jgi:ankyrin repeat protein